jgi:hypothetical protein
MAHAEAKKKRILLAAKNRAKGHSLSKAFRLISDRENISVKTISFWWYQAQKEQEKARATEENEKVSRPVSNSEEVAGQEDRQEPQAPEKSARLLTDSGLMRCSRCRSTSHLEEVEGGFHCNICNHFLAWEEPGDYEVMYRESGYRNHWMA